ncbi:glycosyltransferase [Roseomonas rosulenta]|uniref:glycosyltransferase n=1 Tax=Roseomonas rosulenta TaxID=2748667 RepID=UPI0018DFC796|nr:glycosyltransferase [Roseomonas rosulenta]
MSGETSVDDARVQPAREPAADARVLRLLTLTTLYPNARQPNHGVFVENRLRHLVASGAAQSEVVAPVPWFPAASSIFGEWSRYAGVPAREQRHGLTVHHPRYLALPRLGMLSGPWMLHRAARAAVLGLLRDGRRFDAIDAHYLYPDGVAALWLAREFGLPLVVTARGSDTSLLPRYRLPRRLIGEVIAGADALIAVSQGLREGLVDLGADPARVTVLRNGVDLETFRPPADRAALRAELGLEGPVLLSVGLLIARKGHDQIIAALPDLPGCTLLVAGEGPERAALDALARRLGVADRVRLLGPQPHAALARLYGAADALVLASLREGWANVLLEAMACGTPALAGPAWGSAEAICTPEAGLVLDGVTPGAIAAGVRRLLAEPPDRAATRRHAEGFGWGPTTEGQLTLFRRVLEHRR